MSDERLKPKNYEDKLNKIWSSKSCINLQF